VIHKTSELLSIVHGQESMPMVGDEHHPMAGDSVELLGTAERSNDHLVENWARAQKEPGLDRPAGDFDETAFFGYKA
jgi:hypothetical protein